MFVLDYSSGFPDPAAVVAAGYVGIVRYIGTPGRGKNLTRAEAAAMLAAEVPIGLVYEESAGWMLGGVSAGVRAAQAALADAQNCRVGVRNVFFAADFDVTSTAQMTAVERCLDGAAGVLGRSRVGVYGEADVIDACLGQRHATWGWQTRAWSGGRLSSRAHLLQQVGYVYPGGVQCDRSTVLQQDWGQWPYGEDLVMDAEVAGRFDALETLLNHNIGMVIRGDADSDPGHLSNLRSIRSDLAQLKALGAAQQASITALAQVVAQGTNDLTADEVEESVRKAIKEGLLHVKLDFEGTETA